MLPVYLALEVKYVHFQQLLGFTVQGWPAAHVSHTGQWLLLQPMGFHRKMALKNNVDYICERLQFESGSEELSLVAVA